MSVLKDVKMRWSPMFSDSNELAMMDDHCRLTGLEVGAISVNEKYVCPAAVAAGIGTAEKMRMKDIDARIAPVALSSIKEDLIFSWFEGPCRIYVCSSGVDRRNSYRNLSAKWHATKWSFSTSRSGGSCSLQISIAYGQRGWNLHPEGGLTGLGTSPGRIILLICRSGSGTGTAERSAIV